MKPLERNQLKNWRDYLDFEIAQGDRERVVFLFERCMIACALYEDFWSKVRERGREGRGKGGRGEELSHSLCDITL